jgi:hypothetical protein
MLRRAKANVQTRRHVMNCRARNFSRQLTRSRASVPEPRVITGAAAQRFECRSATGIGRFGLEPGRVLLHSVMRTRLHLARCALRSPVRLFFSVLKRRLHRRGHGCGRRFAPSSPRPSQRIAAGTQALERSEPSPGSSSVRSRTWGGNDPGGDNKVMSDGHADGYDPVPSRCSSDLSGESARGARAFVAHSPT